MAVGRRFMLAVVLLLGCTISTPGQADQIVCTADGKGNDSCDIVQPNVLARSTPYPTLVFQPGDTVVVSASGCAQTGGRGKTWKRYLNPSPTSDNKYFGTILIPGAMPTLVPIRSVAGSTLNVSMPGILTLGYEDDGYDDNGYWSHDDGNNDQCKDQSGPFRGRAVVHLQIHRVAQPPLPAGTVYGQCVQQDPFHETCHIDRPDVTVPSETYPSVRFCPGDAVNIKAGGCVQTGGSGKTWKDFVNPSGPNSDRLYYGMIGVPPTSPTQLVRLQSAVSAPVASTGGVLTLGYLDDGYDDNGYYSHDNGTGTGNQCPTAQAAFVDISITHGHDSRLGCGNVFPVTGTTLGTAAYGQAETAATVVENPGTRRIVVAFNDQTQNPSAPTISWTSTGRSTNAGASLMGWAYSDDDGMTWTYAGKVTPTIPGWPVLWGDPAITAVPDPTAPVVIMSNLAIPSAEFSNGELVKRVGGFCIAKSTDAGTTFSLNQCYSNNDAPVPAGHFYDGESLAATPSGAIFVAFNDFDVSSIDVWSAPNHTAPFVRLAPPFPGMHSLIHARLRAASDGSVYVASSFIGVLPDGSSAPVVYMNRYVNGAWGVPRQASESMVSNLMTIPSIDLHSVVQGSELDFRFAPQFSFDVGSPSVGGQDAVRIMVTRVNAAGLFYVEGSACAADLSGCHPVPEWTVGPLDVNGAPYQALSPIVRASPARRFGRPPRIELLPGEWLTAYYVVHGGTNTAVQAGHMYLNYLNGHAVGTSVELPDALTVCPDNRPTVDGADYWGDYNDMVVLGNSLLAPTFVSFVTRDQQLGCVQREAFFAKHQHVSAVRWNP